MRSYNLLKCHPYGITRAPVWGFIFFSVALLTFLSVASNLSAEPIVADLQPVPGTPGSFRDLNSYTLVEVNAAGGIVIGDKLFEYFSVATTKSVGAIAPDLGEIAITAVQINGDYGLKFNSGWSASAGQIADSTIEFHASILPEYVDAGYAFKDNALYITAYGNSTDNGQVSVSENLYSQHPSFGGSSFANKFVYYKNDNDRQTLDLQEFAPITDMWIVKDVIANGGEGTIGAAHLSEFYQTFSQIPEPSSLALLGFGAIGLVAYAWRKRR